MTPVPQSRASEAAVEAAVKSIGGMYLVWGYESEGAPRVERGRLDQRAVAEIAVEAAHDPALGLDRSVCLRDVLEVVRWAKVNGADDLVALLQRTFTASSSSEGAAGFVSEPSTGGEG